MRCPECLKQYARAEASHERRPIKGRGPTRHLEDAVLVSRVPGHGREDRCPRSEAGKFMQVRMDDVGSRAELEQRLNAAARTEKRRSLRGRRKRRALGDYPAAPLTRRRPRASGSAQEATGAALQSIMSASSRPDARIQPAGSSSYLGNRDDLHVSHDHSSLVLKEANHGIPYCFQSVPKRPSPMHCEQEAG
jgi:hypothetical protein